MQKQRIGVVGAGTAGLRCAALLANDSRLDVTILEARDRVGGRIVQDSRMGMPIDMGANWIHDVELTPLGSSNPITALCSQLSIHTHQWNDKAIILDQNGNVLSEDLSDQAMPDLWDIWGKAASLSKQHFTTKSLSSAASLKDFLMREIESKTRANDSETAKRIMIDLIESWGTYTGEAVADQSLRYYYLEACDQTDEFVVDTYRQIIDSLLSEALAAGATLKLSTDMISCESHPGSQTSGRVLIKTKDCEQFYFDHVILTMPLGWLKKNAATCIRPLDPLLAESIHNTSFGRLEKILVRFPRAFWDDGRAEPLSFIQWLPQNSAVSDHPSWKLEAISLAAFEAPKSAPILMFYIFGDCSTYVCQHTRDKSEEQKQEWLKDFVMPYVRRIPGFDPASCEPTHLINSAWCSDELSLGSYTTFNTGCGNGIENIETMRRGMPEARIWLAGEHTAPLDGLGSVYGAYASAEAVSRRIIEAL